MSRIHSTRITNSNSTVSSDGSTYTYALPHPVDFSYRSVALNQMTIYNSWVNINSQNNTFDILWPEGGVETTYNVTIPEGTYTVSELNEYIEFFLVENGLYLVTDAGINKYYLSIAANHTYYSVTLTTLAIPTSLPSGWTNPGSMTFPSSTQTPRITLPANSTDAAGNDIGFAVVIGFADNATYPSTTKSVNTDTNGSLVPQIALVTSIDVHCNLVDTSEFSSDQILKTVVPQQPSGSLEFFEPSNPIFVPASARKFTEIIITLKDEDARLVNVQDTQGFSVELLIREDPRPE